MIAPEMFSHTYCRFNAADTGHNENETVGVLGYINQYGADQSEIAIADVRKVTGYWRIQFRMTAKIWNRVEGTPHRDYINQIEALHFKSPKEVNEWLYREFRGLLERKWLFK